MILKSPRKNETSTFQSPSHDEGVKQILDRVFARRSIFQF